MDDGLLLFVYVSLRILSCSLRQCLEVVSTLLFSVLKRRLFTTRVARSTTSSYSGLSFIHFCHFSTSSELLRYTKLMNDSLASFLSIFFIFSNMLRQHLCSEILFIYLALSRAVVTRNNDPVTLPGVMLHCCAGPVALPDSN